VWFIPGVAVNERTCAHRALYVTYLETALTKHSALLVSNLKQLGISLDGLQFNSKLKPIILLPKYITNY
jgi:hypothetical protein